MSKIETKLPWIHRHIPIDIFYKTFVCLLNKLALSMHIRCYLSKNNDKSLRMLIAQCQLRLWALCLLTKSLHFLPEGE